MELKIVAVSVFSSSEEFWQSEKTKKHLLVT